jgi:hypothetical protein
LAAVMGLRRPAPQRAHVYVLVGVVALSAAAVAAFAMRGGSEIAEPRPYHYVDVLSVFNATGVPTGLRTGGGRLGASRDLPDGYYATVEGGGHWGATVFEDVSSAAAEEKSLTESLAKAFAASDEMLATNTTQPQWLSVPRTEKSVAARVAALAEHRREPKSSIARCANVVVIGIRDEPNRVCAALAALSVRFRMRPS